jgi:hypothetical protein
MKSILWILNGCGLEGKGITGGPVIRREVTSALKVLVRCKVIPELPKLK